MTQTINVEGMSCEGCEQAVEDALSNVEGVTDVKADREAKQATVEGDATEEELAAAVEDAGYSASA